MKFKKQVTEIIHFYGKSLPTILASMSTPLLGMADIAVIGYLNDAKLIAGVSVGAQIFDTLYWVFGSLQFVSAGNSAQSNGSHNRQARFNALCQPLCIALLIFILLLIFQTPLVNLFLSFIAPEAAVAAYAIQYYHILIFSCFFVLADYIIRGWLLGQGKTVLCMLIQIVCTSLNVILDLVFVQIFQAGILGVAWATFIAQTIAFILELIYLISFASFQQSDIDLKSLLDHQKTFFFLKQNGDVFLRTLCLVVIRNAFTAYGSRFGTIPLAGNAVIYQIVNLMTYSIGALGNTATISAGFEVGRKDKNALISLWHTVFHCTWFMALMESCLLMIFAEPLFYVFTNEPSVIAFIMEYRHWIFLSGISCCFCNTMMGFYVGCSYTKIVRNGAFISMLSFFFIAICFIPLFGNNALWTAQITYWIVNGLIFLSCFSGLIKKVQWD